MGLRLVLSRPNSCIVVWNQNDHTENQLHVYTEIEVVDCSKQHNVVGSSRIL
jgi:hypothetical protein